MKLTAQLLLLCFILFSPVVVPSVYAAIVINEFLPAPSSGNAEWVEFYNTDISTEDLSNYYFDDDTNFDSDSGSSGKVALSGLLSSNATCYIEFSAYLNNNGDTPTIFKLDGALIDSYQYASSSADKSYARVPDGGTWQINQTPTKSSLKCSDLAPPPTPTHTPIPTQSPTPTAIPVAATSTPTPIRLPTHTLTPTVPAGQPILSDMSSSASSFATTEAVLGMTEGLPEATTSSKLGQLRPIIISLSFTSAGLALLCGLFAWQKFKGMKTVNKVG